MPDLNEHELEKLKDMIETWDKVALAIKFLSGLGTAIKWLIGLAGSVALIWAAFHGQGK